MLAQEHEKLKAANYEQPDKPDKLASSNGCLDELSLWLAPDYALNPVLSLWARCFFWRPTRYAESI